ncbi:MAG: hypothetical protein AYK22_06690 [Thermoplasmatales archaeon SG8-52-3]|nr:MAG: hypothetical protein AYK22_06690 [Thermoplasmatales archaeon SG8-52-3]
MKANRKFIEEQDAISAVIGVILMVAITVAIAAVTFVYFTGLMGSPETEKENASVAVKNENAKIKLTLVSGGKNLPSTGYAFSNSIIIRLNGTELTEGALAVGNDGWDVGESLYIGNAVPALDDNSNDVNQLGPGDYSITVTIIETVIYDDIVKVI